MIKSFMEKSDSRKKTITAILAALAYAALTLVWVFHHEIWADEVNVWLILKNLSFTQAVMQITVEGHPFFFYLICLPFVKMGFSMFSVQMICHLACSTAVFLLFRFSPFPFILKVIVALGAGLFYFFPVMARSYSVLPLLLFSIASLYPKILEKEVPIRYLALYVLLIAFTANTHVVMYAFALCMSVNFIYERIRLNSVIKNMENSKIVHFFKNFKNLRKEEKIIIPCLIAGLLPPVFTVCLAMKANASFSHSLPGFSNAIATLRKIIVNFYDFLSPDLALKTNCPHILSIFVSLAIIVVLTMIIFFMKKKSSKLMYASIFSILFQIAIYVVSYSAYIFPNRILIIPLILLFFSWIASYENREENSSGKHLIVSLAILFLISIPGGLYAIGRDYRDNFSSAREMADYIMQNIPDKPNVLVFTTESAVSLGIAYHLGKRPLYDYRGNPVICYSPTPWFSPDYIKSMLKPGDEAYLVMFRAEGHYLGMFDVLYRTKPSILSNEIFYLVRIV